MFIVFNEDQSSYEVLSQTLDRQRLDTTNPKDIKIRHGIR